MKVEDYMDHRVCVGERMSAWESDSSLHGLSPEFDALMESVLSWRVWFGGICDKYHLLGLPKGGALRILWNGVEYSHGGRVAFGREIETCFENFLKGMPK